MKELHETNLSFFSMLKISWSGINPNHTRPPYTHYNILRKQAVEEAPTNSQQQGNPSMLTPQQTERARLQKEKQAAEAALKLQMEKGQLKRLEEKKKQNADHKQEEELRKIAEAEQHKAEELETTEATVVSPTTQMEEEKTGRIPQSTLISRICCKGVQKTM